MSQERSDQQGTVGVWPSLPLTEWKDTYDTLHMWTQVVGKVALAQAPMINHWWHATLHVTARGISTPPLPHGNMVFQIEFDFIDHRLNIEASDGSRRSIGLHRLSVADFYAEVMDTLSSFGLGVKVWPVPVEVESRIPCNLDREHASYNPEYAHRFWLILLQSDRVFREFRSRFIGKVSPVQFFWGSFDLAVTRFSGRRAPAYSGGAFNVARGVMEEAYSHEVSSLGFWPGGGSIPYPVYYSYASPQPAGFAEARVLPESAFYSKDLGEFILPYDDVRRAGNPEEMLLEFAQTSYDAAADLGRWDRASLERGDVQGGGGGS